MSKKFDSSPCSRMMLWSPLPLPIRGALRYFAGWERCNSSGTWSHAGTRHVRRLYRRQVHGARYPGWQSVRIFKAALRDRGRGGWCWWKRWAAAPRLVHCQALSQREIPVPRWCLGPSAHSPGAAESRNSTPGILAEFRPGSGLEAGKFSRRVAKFAKVLWDMWRWTSPLISKVRSAASL